MARDFNPVCGYASARREARMNVGDRVIKAGGDYIFEGEIVAVFKKRNGVIRLAVEDDRGVVMIMNEGQVKVMA